MVKLGVSLYPEQEKLEDIDRYLAMASKYGFEKVFTSLFSVKGTKEEIVAYFKSFTAIAHKYNMKVSGDANGEFFRAMGATETDLSVFREMGIDIIRMDFSFRDERDAILINNKEGIGIEMSTGSVDVIEKAIANGANPKNIATCHNFYPERYSGPTLEAINKVSEYWKEKGISVAIFVSSQEKGTHGPWPVSAGLPTIEEHRGLPLEVQVKHCLALRNVDEILIGNAYASEEELKAVAKVMEKVYVDIPRDDSIPMIADLLPHGHLMRIPFKIHTQEGLSEAERKLVFDYPSHHDMGDCLNYMLRCRWTRFGNKDLSIPYRPCNQTHFTRGDVVIVNDNLAHYRGEVQVVLKDMEADGERNLIGRIDEKEIMLLDHIGKNDLFIFVE